MVVPKIHKGQLPNTNIESTFEFYTESTEDLKCALEELDTKGWVWASGERAAAYTPQGKNARLKLCNATGGITYAHCTTGYALSLPQYTRKASQLIYQGQLPRAGESRGRFYFCVLSNNATACALKELKDKDWVWPSGAAPTTRRKPLYGKYVLLLRRSSVSVAASCVSVDAFRDDPIYTLDPPPFSWISELPFHKQSKLPATSLEQPEPSKQTLPTQLSLDIQLYANKLGSALAADAMAKLAARFGDSIHDVLRGKPHEPALRRALIKSLKGVIDNLKRKY